MKCQNCGKVDHDEDAIFCESCGAKLINGNSSATLNETDMKMLNIIRVASQKDDVLAAFYARHECYRICKKETQRNDYGAYVEALQLDYFPKEFKKAEYGKTYNCLTAGLLLTVFAIIICVIIFICDYYTGFIHVDYFWIAYFIILTLMVSLIFFAVRMHEIAKCIKELK